MFDGVEDDRGGIENHAATKVLHAERLDDHNNRIVMNESAK